jgi:hypothetical protein
MKRKEWMFCMDFSAWEEHIEFDKGKERLD